MSKPGLRVDLAPGDEIHFTGGGRVAFEHKSGRKAAVRVEADPGSTFFHVREAGEAEEIPTIQNG